LEQNMSENVNHTSLVDTAISVAAHLESELEEALAEHRLTRPSFLVLDALDGAEGGSLGQRELVGRVRRTSGTLSVRLGRLERARLIDREPARLAEGLPEGVAPTLGEHLHHWLTFFEPGEREAPRLGVAVAGAAAAKRMRRAVGLPDVPGIIVLRVGRDTAAATAGVNRGDLVTDAAGSPVRSIGDLERAVQRADGTLRLKVLRGADPHELEVSLNGAAE
jgi:hypothetical protein